MHSLELPSCSDVIISQWYTLLNFPVVPNIQYFCVYREKTLLVIVYTEHEYSFIRYFTR